jgi:4-hydroxybenzoate polyprenyltransferase
MSRPPAHARVLAWWQLLRAGNVFTALSNIAAGYLLSGGYWPPIALGFWCLAAASVLIYSAGMVLNDAFDAPIDAVERPGRPIPSGRVSHRAAFAVGWQLLGGGVAAAIIISALAANPMPGIVASCLAVMVVMYDGGLKSTWAGPWAMGWCRTLNVLLGASAAPIFHGRQLVWAYAGGIGLYTVLLTYIARSEAAGDPARHVARRRLVKAMILGFIVLDSFAVTYAAGWQAGLTVLALLIPTLLLARAAPMT